MIHVLARLLDFSGIRFVLLSGSSFLINVGLTVGLSELAHLREEFSFLIALVTVFLANFLGMRYWVYGDTTQRLGFLAQLVCFLPSTLGFRGLEYAAFLLLHTLLGLHYVLAVLIVLVVGSLSKFFFYRITIFGSKTSATCAQPGLSGVVLSHEGESDERAFRIAVADPE